MTHNVLQAGAEAANRQLGRAAFALACCYVLPFSRP